MDADQSFLGAHVLTSAMKRVDKAVFRMIRSVIDGNWKGGVNVTFGLAEDGVGLGKLAPRASRKPTGRRSRTPSEDSRPARIEIPKSL